MKPKNQFLTLPPIIKGVPTEEVRALWRARNAHGFIQRRYPSLTWVDIDEIVHADRYAHVQTGLAEGKTISQIARELRCSTTNVGAILKKMKRNEFLRTAWGGLSQRAITALEKYGCKTLLEIQNDPPTEDKILSIKGVGRYLLDEIKSVVPLKPGEYSTGVVITKPPAPWIKMPRPPKTPKPVKEPMMYVTKASHFKGALNNPAAAEPAKQLARFFDAVVKFAQMVPLMPDEMLPSDVPCMAGPPPRRWCLGVLDIYWGHDPLRVHWECSDCGKHGVVTEVDPPPLTPSHPSPGDRLQ